MIIELMVEDACFRCTYMVEVSLMIEVDVEVTVLVIGKVVVTVVVVEGVGTARQEQAVEMKFGAQAVK